MLSSRAIGRWRAVHTWSSLICTVFLLMLCLTGLPLIFHDEIDDWLAGRESAAPPPAGAVVDMDRVIRTVRQAYPGRRVQFVAWADEPGQFRVGLGRGPAAAGHKPFVIVDSEYRLLGEAWSEKDWRHGGVMAVLLALHTDLLSGLWGGLFLGAMGLLFLAALVSGVVLYAPFTRKLAFGTVRRARAARVAWLDLHNLAGITTIAWAVVVGATGVVNTLDSLVFGAWQRDVSRTLKAQYGELAPVRDPDLLQAAVTRATAFLPGRDISFVAFPGSMFATPRHYAVYLHGNTPATSQLLHPVLIDAADGQLVDIGAPPWYLWSLEISRPLHFGDYGGLPLKLLWAALDVETIVVLGSGVYLWLARRRKARQAPATAAAA
ncbi:PepSY domain-containing protein [Pigmentiphaga soli]|uniref:PepSY domain-containing protein n=1 Tax=Pigmentiphaga soli TaxID=1007095 RepID=A0ABP8HEX8_9BURK